MERGTWQPLFATNYMANLHQMVIHNIGEVIGWQIVSRFIQHLIIEDIRVDDYFSTDKVMHMYIHMRIANIIMVLRLLAISCELLIRLI
jgi:hypothetical protein